MATLPKPQVIGRPSAASIEFTTSGNPQLMKWVPGSKARALAKAKNLPSDALIFDLEDAVAPDAKVSARDQVCVAVGMGGSTRSRRPGEWRIFRRWLSPVPTPS